MTTVSPLIIHSSSSHQSRSIRNAQVDLLCETGESLTQKQIIFCNNYHEELKEERAANAAGSIFVISFLITLACLIYIEFNIKEIGAGWIFGGALLVAFCSIIFFGCPS